MRRILGTTALLVLAAAACSSGGGDDVATADTSTTSTTVDPDAFVFHEGIEEQELPPELAAQFDAIPLPDTDAALPEDVPSTASGSPGFSHYVFQDFDGEIVATVVEGNRGQQYRCQQEELPCSYTELLALYESGDDIPPELGMTRAELADLVAELKAVHDTLARFADPDDACAAGYRPQPVQIPNMGSHFVNLEYVFDGIFDPAKPEIILYGVTDNVSPEGAFFARCEDGKWGGDVPITSVGASFILPPEQFGYDNPTAFTGPIDQWHIHYNLCNGSRPVPNKEACTETGGSFASAVGWMIHVWTEEDYDNQLGVFSMWNSGLWPVSEPGAMRERFDAATVDNLVTIENFDFGEPLTVSVGDEIVFNNNDSVPHTVTGTDGFDDDSGLVAPGTTYRITFDDAGDYRYFCTLHPGMRGQIVVE